MSTSKVVTITVYDGGDFGYDHALAGVSSGDSITWQAGQNTGDFGITFLTASSPLTSGALTPPSGSATTPITATLKSGLTLGDVYHYSVWAKYQPSGIQYSDPNCPELIIR